jgi:putative hydrolase of the HAD superfamily
MTQFDAVIFDLFETLVTEFEPAWRPGPSAADRLGVPVPVFTEVWHTRHNERMTSVVDFREVLREVCARADLVVGADTGQIIEALYAERLAAKAKTLIAVEPRILGALEQLRDAGLKIGVISNCAIEEVAAWAGSPLAPLFDDATFSYQVGVAKPSREIYLQSCREIGVAPERTAYVGDGGSDELQGACSAGLTAHCARWFLDQWPAERSNRDRERRRGFPTIMNPTDLPVTLSRNRR